MEYFRNRVEAYRHPTGVMDGVRSILMLAFPYPAAVRAVLSPGDGRLARYLWEGDDYHDRLHDRLRAIARKLVVLAPDSRLRGVVDTAPILEREFGRMAGMGWQGKNTLLINKWSGSYFFLCCLLTDLDLPVNEPHESDHCGTCTRCLDACPTQAFPQPGVLDARRCVSYLTIEHRGPISLELREGLGDWLFGCDVCQEVCPWNRDRSQVGGAEGFGVQSDSRVSNKGMGEELVESLRLDELFLLDDETFRARFRKTPLWRARRRGILRNAAIVLGNQGDRKGLDALALGVRDSEPLVRGASAWALGKIGGVQAKELLQHRLAIETDSMVLAEIEGALRQLGLGES
jgi:epoxyqueuosine reductase